MRSDRLRRTTAATAATFAVLGLGACSKTNFSAQTSQQYQAGIGADVRDSAVQILGGLVVGNSDGSGTLSATFVNTTDEPQTLQGITVTDGDGDSVDVTTTGDDLVVPAGGTVRVGRTEPSTSKIFTLLEVDPGLYYDITATFDGAGEVSLHLPAVARSEIYADIAGDPGFTEESDAPAEDEDHSEESSSH